MSAEKESTLINEEVPKEITATFLEKDENGMSCPAILRIPLTEGSLEIDKEKAIEAIVRFTEVHPNLAEIPGLKTLLEELETD